MKKIDADNPSKKPKLQTQLMIWTLGLVLLLGLLQVLLINRMTVVNVPKTIQMELIRPTLQSQSSTQVEREEPPSMSDGANEIGEVVQRQMWIISAISLIALLIIGTIGSFIVSNHVSRPVDLFSEQIASINVNSLEKRLIPSGKGHEIDRMASEINKTLDRLEQAFRSQEQFVLDAAHELRTPLSTLHAQVEILQAKQNKGEGVPEAILSAQGKNLVRMEAIVEDLLLLAKGKQQFPEECVDLSQLIGEICMDLQWLAEKHEVKLMYEAEEIQVIQANPMMIDRLIRNLIVNAIQYNKPKGVVKINLKPKPEALFLSIQDSGIGIAQEDLPHIFDRFYRVDPSRSRLSGGTGLGLAIVRHIAELYKAEITVESEVAKGSCFIVSFPKIE
ncbi:MAG: ATP-binding protein [Chloroflexota bacterium]|jgi:two-component system OmpR family sensor kinase|nr:ATP-binding protein [Chloroflexota bacterium]